MFTIFTTGFLFFIFDASAKFFQVDTLVKMLHKRTSLASLSHYTWPRSQLCSYKHIYVFVSNISNISNISI
jgi:hypothetical protein